MCMILMSFAKQSPAPPPALALIPDVDFVGDSPKAGTTSSGDLDPGGGHGELVTCPDVNTPPIPEVVEEGPPHSPSITTSPGTGDHHQLGERGDSSEGCKGGNMVGNAGTDDAATNEGRTSGGSYNDAPPPPGISDGGHSAGTGDDAGTGDYLQSGEGGNTSERCKSRTKVPAVAVDPGASDARAALSEDSAPGDAHGWDDMCPDTADPHLLAVAGGRTSDSPSLDTPLGSRGHSQSGVKGNTSKGDNSGTDDAATNKGRTAGGSDNDALPPTGIADGGFGTRTGDNAGTGDDHQLGKEGNISEGCKDGTTARFVAVNQGTSDARAALSEDLAPGDDATTNEGRLGGGSDDAPPQTGISDGEYIMRTGDDETSFATRMLIERVPTPSIVKMTKMYQRQANDGHKNIKRLTMDMAARHDAAMTDKQHYRFKLGTGF